MARTESDFGLNRNLPDLEVQEFSFWRPLPDWRARMIQLLPELIYEHAEGAPDRTALIAGDRVRAVWGRWYFCV